MTGSVVGPEGYAACYLGHSGVILLAGLTSLGTSTLLLLHQYLKSSDPRRCVCVCVCVCVKSSCFLIFLYCLFCGYTHLSNLSLPYIHVSYETMHNKILTYS